MEMRARVAGAALLVVGLYASPLSAESTYDKSVEASRLQEADGKQSLAIGSATDAAPQAKVSTVSELCQQVGRKLGSVSTSDCLAAKLTSDGGHSHNGLPMAWVEFPPLAQRQPEGRVLVLGGIHGDEYSAVSIVFHWLKILDQYHSGLFHWRVVPVSNPDGLLQRRSQRMNANGVDLNRNFPTDGWEKEAPRYWAWTGRNKRRYPGEAAASEPETRWIMRQIEAFQPDIIVQIHAPYGIVDFDGNDKPPQNLGRLHLNLLGTFPGSLGNYGGNKLDIPVLTVELPSAGVLPSRREQSKIWVDLVRWLRARLPREPGREVQATVADDLKAAAESGLH
jgi:hypothetical protein